MALLLRAELAEVHRQMLVMQADAKARIGHLIDLDQEQVA